MFLLCSFHHTRQSQVRGEPMAFPYLQGALTLAIKERSIPFNADMVSFQSAQGRHRKRFGRGKMVVCHRDAFTYTWPTLLQFGLISHAGSGSHARASVS